MAKRTPIYAGLSRWTPKAAAAFAKRRIAKIDHLLIEIGAIYGDVYEPVINEADRFRSDLDQLTKVVDEALSEGASI